MWDLSSLTRDRTQAPCIGVLTAGQLGKSLAYYFYISFCTLLFSLINVFWRLLHITPLYEPFNSLILEIVN